MMVPKLEQREQSSRLIFSGENIQGRLYDHNTVGLLSGSLIGAHLRAIRRGYRVVGVGGVNQGSIYNMRSYRFIR